MSKGEIQLGEALALERALRALITDERDELKEKVSKYKAALDEIFDEQARHGSTFESLWAAVFNLRKACGRNCSDDFRSNK